MRATLAFDDDLVRMAQLSEVQQIIDSRSP